MSYRPRIRDLVLAKDSAIPLYLQLKHHIVHLISSGEWKPGMSLPSVRQIASELGVATATVQRAYGELEAQGLVVGHSGRAVYVAELAVGPERHLARDGRFAAERGAVLDGVLAPAVAHARSLGFREEEIVGAVRALAGGGREGELPVPRVVFVGSKDEVLDKYRDLLAASLGDVGVTVDTMLVSELVERGDAALDEREPICCLVSLVGSFADLRRLAASRGRSLFGLVVDLTEATQRRLVELPHDAPIGLVAEEHYLPSARAVLRQFLGGEEHVRIATDSQQPRVRRLLRECRTVVHTFGAKRLLESLAQPETELVELQFRPNPSSLARLRALVIRTVALTGEGPVSDGQNGRTRSSQKPAISPGPAHQTSPLSLA